MTAEVAIDSTAAEPWLKELFPTGRVKKQLYPRHPLFAMLKKDPTLSGEMKVIPIVYNATNGASADFPTAQANKDKSSSARFNIEVVQDYSLANFTRKLMLQTRDDKGARLKAAEMTYELILYTAGRSLSNALYRDGYGVLGTISSGSTVASTTITLTNISDVVAFQAGMVLVASPYNQAEGYTLRTGTGMILSVNRSTGVLTNSGGTNWSASITSLHTGDYLYRQGDAQNAASPVASGNLKITGLQGWLPSTAPSAGENFFNVDRSVDPTRLAGFYFDASTYPIEEAVIEAQSRINVESMGVDTWFMNPIDKRKLQKAMQSRVVFGERQSSDVADISFNTLRIDGDKGPIDIIGDPDCPPGNTTGGCPLLRLASWTLHSMLETPHIFDEGTAQEALRDPGGDNYECRSGYYAQLGPTENDAGPGDSGSVKLPA